MIWNHQICSILTEINCILQNWSVPIRSPQKWALTLENVEGGIRIDFVINISIVNATP